MKSILVPIYPHDGLRSVLEHTALVGEAFGSYIEGFAVQPVVTVAVVDPTAAAMGLAAVEDPSGHDETRRLLEQVIGGRAAASSDPQLSMSMNWRDEAPRGEDFLASYSHGFDLTVMGRPARGNGPRKSLLESVLFESGRPVLVAPPRPSASLGTTIVIAWNGSSETARSIAFAMPFLQRASRVVVLTIEGGVAPGDGPSGDRMACSLQTHGISAQAVTARPGKASVGEAILGEATALGCDLLIKGAYTQSRLRQMIFGGPTEHILWNSDLPVLMAH